MRAKRLIPIVLAVAALVAVWLLWPGKSSRSTERKSKANTEKTGNQKETAENKLQNENFSENKNAEIPEKKNYSFILKPGKTKTVSFELAGTFENAKSWSAGDHFNKNDLLFQLDNSSLFTEISRKKSELKSRVESLYEQITKESPEAYPKWHGYGDAITETDLLPPLPENISAKERALVNTSGIVPLSMQIAQKEQEIFAYFYLAPFDGRIKNVKVRTGQNVSAGQTIAVIYPDESVFLERKVHKNDLETFTQQGKMNVKGKNGRKTISLRFKAGRQSGDSVLIFAAIPYNKLELFDFFETVEITPNNY